MSHDTPKDPGSGGGAKLILILQMRKLDLRKMGTYRLSQDMPNPRHWPYSAYFDLVFLADFFLSFETQ